MTPDTDDGRITLTKLGVLMDTMIKQQDHLIVKFEEHAKESYIRDTRITRCEERIDRYSGFNAVLAFIMSAIAGWIGVNK